MVRRHRNSTLFFFNDTATTEIYTLSLHDALPIYRGAVIAASPLNQQRRIRTRESVQSQKCSSRRAASSPRPARQSRSEEHTSELQSRQYLVCRLLLEKKKPISRLPYSHCRTSITH